MCKIFTTIKNLIVSTIFMTNIVSATQFITVMTGGADGSYFLTGGTICKIINLHKGDTKPICDVRPSINSIESINRLKNGEIDFALVEPNTLIQAYNGKDKFKNKSYKNLRSVIAIYPELLFANKDRNISKIIDIKNKNSSIRRTKAILITSSDVDEKTVYYITKTILDNFETLKKQHPMYKNLTKKSLLEGLTIKQHKGAVKAFKEQGLINTRKNNPKYTVVKYNGLNFKLEINIINKVVKPSLLTDND